jgi:23S rRNA (cytidine2498-2'-O)-methyltransferase
LLYFSRNFAILVCYRQSAIVIREVVAPERSVTRAILTCSPYFTDLALNELHRQHPQITVSQELAPGYLVLEAPCSFTELSIPWRHRLPIYLHHLCPVHEELSLNVNLSPLQEAVHRLATPDTAIQVRCLGGDDGQFTPLEILRSLNDGIDKPRTQPPAGRILSVVIAPDRTAYLGISWAEHNLSPWPGGQLPITEPVSNRAGYKLLEALDVFSIRLRRGDHALDLGAAPGAWTTLLRRRGLRVTAVAPAPLYPWLAFDDDVLYHPVTAEIFLSSCQTTFDLIVNDIYLDARDSAQLMVAYARHLRNEGIAIMTLKLAERNRRRVMDHSLRILRRAYKIIRVRQLVSNRREVTLFLRRKP